VHRPACIADDLVDEEIVILDGHFVTPWCLGVLL
jgi:hypothetical protein